MKTRRQAPRPQVRDYLKIVEWSKEDQCYVGSAPPLVGRCCHADNEADVLKQLSVITEEVLALHLAEGLLLPPPAPSCPLLPPPAPESSTAASFCSVCAPKSTKPSTSAQLKPVSPSTATVPG